MPKYSNMSYEIQGCMLLDDVTSHVTILNLYLAYSGQKLTRVEPGFDPG